MNSSEQEAVSSTGNSSSQQCRERVNYWGRRGAGEGVKTEPVASSRMDSTLFQLPDSLIRRQHADFFLEKMRKMSAVLG